MEPDRRLVGVRTRERAEAAERALGSVLVELPDGAGDLRLDVAGVPARRPIEDARRRDRPPDPLEADAVQQLLAKAAVLGGDAERLELAGGRKLRDPGGRGEGGDERREPAREVRVQQVAGDDGVGRVGLRLESCDRQAAVGSPSFAQSRASPRWSCTTAASGYSFASCSSRSSDPSGQPASAAPTFPSSESCFAKSAAAAASSPRAYSDWPFDRSRASGSVRKPRANESGGRPSRGFGVVVA